MSKKKKKKKSISILQEVDKTLNGTYDDLMEEIQDMQLQLAIADQKARKKAKKKGKKNAKDYSFQTEQRKVREELITKMTGNNFLERVNKVLEDILPIVIVIARLVASLILSILSLDIVKVNIKPETLKMMNAVYNKAMAIS